MANERDREADAINRGAQVVALAMKEAAESSDPSLPFVANTFVDVLRGALRDAYRSGRRDESIAYLELRAQARKIRGLQ